ncbi:MAG: O-antigen ligase family protein [Anaerolineae bacterium]|nr:O-antigen ligase family protein [Anaerolineae bacterium]
MTNFKPRWRWRLLPTQIGILITFALIPVWYRFRGSPQSFTAFYSTGFLIFWPMLFTVIFWILTGLPGLRDLIRSRIRFAWTLLLLALVGWAFLSWSWAFIRMLRPEVAISSAIPFGLAALFAIVVACAGPSARSIVATLVIALIWNSAVAFLQVGEQGPIGLKVLGEFNINPALSGVSIVQSGEIRWLRPYGLLPHPNIFAGFLVIGLLASVAWVASRRLTHWYIGTVIFLFGLWALLLTFSRASWIGFAAGAFALLPLLWRFRLRERDARLTLIATLGLAVLVAGVFGLVYRPFLAARAGVGAESVEQRSVSDRNIYNMMGIQAGMKWPILGLGIGNFPWYAQQYLTTKTNFDLQGQPAHHVLLSAWAELGIVGFGLTGLLLILGVEAALRGLRSAAEQEGEGLKPSPPKIEDERIARAVLLVGVIALMIIGLLDHYPWTLLQFQAAWWGLLAAAGKPFQPQSTTPNPPLQP